MKKTLQSIGLFLGLTVATTSFAQLPNNGVYPGGLKLTSYVPATATASYVLQTWDIDSILDQGQSVILDLFATWCGPCWSTHNSGLLENLYNDAGYGGTSDMAIFAIDADPATAASTLEGGGSSLGDWITGTVYPMVDNDVVANMFNLRAYPTIIMICPDRKVKEVRVNPAGNALSTVADYKNYASTCGGLATNANDPRISSNNSVATQFNCGSYNEFEAKIAIQNYSIAAINGNYDVELYDGATLVASTTVALNLAPYAAVEVSLGMVSPSVDGNNTYDAKITTTNDDLSNDEITFDVFRVSAVDMKIQGTEVEMAATFDSKASDFSFVFDEGTPPTLNLFTLYNATLNGQIIPKVFRDFRHVADGTASTSETMTINNYDCHYFSFFDLNQNGLNTGSSGNGITISTRGGSAFVDGSYNAGNMILINFVECLPTESSVDVELSVSSPSITLEDGQVITAEMGNPGTVEGTYTVLIDNMDGCDSVITYNITENVDLGVTPNGNIGSLSVFPNPAKDLTNVSLTLTETSTVSIQLVNTLGQTVFTNTLGQVNGENRVEINTSNLGEGIYFVNLNVDGVVKTRRIAVIK